jgi:Leucine-rich repeat (LRR) protein
MYFAIDVNLLNLLQVKQLEIFQQSIFKKVFALRFFVDLTKLEIMNQFTITHMGDLSALVLLEDLTIADCALKEITGLSKLKELRILNLDCNQITSMNGIQGLNNLEQLNLSENKIKVIEGIEHCTKIHTLSLASNQIKHVSSVLFHLNALTELNLANNLLSSFDELRHLSRLKSLKVMFLNDPHYGRNPVCNLCNYHTYMLYHLQFLTILDSIRLSPEAIAVAEATYLKKQMYYNMRVKTCKRSSTTLVRIAEGVSQVRSLLPVIFSHFLHLFVRRLKRK